MTITRVGYEGIRPPTTQVEVGKAVDAGFANTLDQALDHHAAEDLRPAESEGNLRWSRHALSRLESRGIELTADDLDDLAHGADLLADKNSKEGLLLMDDHAFILGVPKRTIITAMTRKEAIGNVFTSIDSTVVIR